ncbi:transposase family protein [Tissierella creatinini]|nr:transposase family protein [Tissierella creatinini]TJX59538.1 transposase family protein [Soehngenia saccharolytica]
MFNHEKIFTAALQLHDPPFVERVEFEDGTGELHIYINFKKGSRFSCLECGTADLKVHDTTEKVLRHLNLFQYKASIHFRTPRTICPEHWVRMIQVPWAASGSGFMLIFEAFVLHLAQSMPIM